MKKSEEEYFNSIITTAKEDSHRKRCNPTRDYWNDKARAVIKGLDEEKGEAGK